MQRILTAIGVVLVWITLKQSCNEAVVFKFTNAVCESYNESWFIFHQCRLYAVNRKKNTLNYNVTILHPARDISVHMQFFKKANGYKPWLYNVTFDVCRFLKKPYNPIVKLVFNLFKEFSNFNHTCPYLGTQFVQGFYLRPELLGLSIPSSDYLLAMTWFFDKKPQFLTNIYFVFTEDL